jgi:hypothetical protein
MDALAVRGFITQMESALVAAAQDNWDTKTLSDNIAEVLTHPLTHSLTHSFACVRCLARLQCRWWV